MATSSTNAKNGSKGAVEAKGTTTNDGAGYTVVDYSFGGQDTVVDWGTTSMAAAIMKVAKSQEYGTPSGYTVFKSVCARWNHHLHDNLLELWCRHCDQCFCHRQDAKLLWTMPQGQ